MKSAKSSGKPTVSIIGLGRLGTAFALVLKTAGYKVQAVVVKRKASAARAGLLVGKNVLTLNATQMDKLPPSELTLITTPDDAISEVVQTLPTAGTDAKGRTVLHTSGALSSAVLEPLTAIGYHIGSIHPLVSVSNLTNSEKTLRGAFYCLEGDRTAKKVAQSLVDSLDGHSFSIAPNKKALYHAAAVMSSGHMVALLDLAGDMLLRCGLNPRESRKVLVPLIESTVGNLESGSPASALTGTFARADLGTVSRHLEAFGEEDLYTAREVYRLLGAHSLDIAKHEHDALPRVAEIRKLLNRVDK